jgi:hypothetical protein
MSDGDPWGTSDPSHLVSGRYMSYHRAMKNKAWMVLAVLLLPACGGETKETPPATPTAPSAVPSASAAPVETAAAPASAAPSATAAPTPPPEPKTKFASFAKAATSGKVDKVGSGDGAFKPDGVKDLVFDAEIDGAVTAVIVASTDASGQPNGEFTADSFVGTETLPSELAGNLNQGKFTGGVVVYMNGKLVNAKDGSVSLPEGKHKVTLYVSSKDAPKGSSYKAFVVGSDKLLAASPVVK